MDLNEISVKTFNKYAKEYQDKYMDFDLYTGTYDNLTTLLYEKSALSVLEIGCGPANVSSYLIKENPQTAFEVHGIDLAPNMIALARENIPTGTFEVMDCRDISNIESKFDLIVCGFCTPYLSKTETMKLFEDMNKRLNNGGLLYLSTMEGNEELSGYQTSASGDSVYVYYHSYEFLKECLINSGFDIVNVERKVFSREGHDPVTDMFLYASTSNAND